MVILHGDETGEQMLAEALRCLPAQVAFEDYDLSLENRIATDNQVVIDASRAIMRHGSGVKAATITESTVGSPNLIIREQMDADVIVRTGRRLPGIAPRAGVHHPIHVVRMATGEAYGATESREGEAGDVDEIARRTETISRRACRSVAEYSFLLAQRERGLVFGGPKWTVSDVFEAMFKEELDRAAGLFPEVPYRPRLIDATYAGIVNGQVTDQPTVIPALNRDGDCLADLVLPLFGSIAGAGSAIIACDDEYRVTACLHEAAHGTAPDLLDKNAANPLAMILACAAAMEDLPSQDGLDWTGAQLRDAAMRALQEGERTRDLGGSCSMSGFADAVLARVGE
jgi:isocitrate/isopropylmalate dehydrogenase